MKKKILSILLASLMVASTAAGCGATAESEGAGDSGFVDGKWKETQELKVTLLNVAPLEEGANTDVIAAVNEITKDQINVEVDINQVFIADYMTKVPTALAAKEDIDLVMFTAIPAASFPTMVAQNQLAGVTQDELDTYAPDVQDVLGEYLNATKVDDMYYGFPNYRQYDSSMYLMMRTDMLDELGMTEQAENVTTWSDVETIFAAVKDKLDNGGFDCEENKSIAVFGPTDNQGTLLTPALTVCGGEKLADATNFDGLGDIDKFLYVDESTNTVKCIFESDFYKEAMDRVADWTSKGYIYSGDYANNSGDTGMGGGCFFSYLSTGEYGQEAKKESATGKDLVAVNIAPAIVTTDMVYRWGLGITSYSSNKEAALTLINLLYTNADIENTLCYGVEGTNYTVNENGEAVADYSAGYISENFLYPNQFNAYPVVGQGSTFMEDAKEVMESTELSPYFGLVVITDDATSDMVSQIRDYLSTDQIPMEAGSLPDGETVDSQIAKLIEDCNSVGMQDVIAYYQEQLDAFLEK